MNSPESRESRELRNYGNYGNHYYTINTRNTGINTRNTRNYEVKVRRLIMINNYVLLSMLHYFVSKFSYFQSLLFLFRVNR